MWVLIFRNNALTLDSLGFGFTCRWRYLLAGGETSGAIWYLLASSFLLLNENIAWENRYVYLEVEFYRSSYSHSSSRLGIDYSTSSDDYLLPLSLYVTSMLADSSNVQQISKSAIYRLIGP